MWELRNWSDWAEINPASSAQFHMKHINLGSGPLLGLDFGALILRVTVQEWSRPPFSIQLALAAGRRRQGR